MASNQASFFDGFTVSLWDGKFNGTFDLEDDIAADMAFDDVVTFIVTARVGGVNINDNKNGDIKRTNVFQVTSANALDRQMAEKVLNSIGAAVQGVNAGQMKLPATNPIQTGYQAGAAVAVDDDDDGDAAIGTPVQDEVLKKFLNES